MQNPREERVKMDGSGVGVSPFVTSTIKPLVIEPMPIASFT